MRNTTFDPSNLKRLSTFLADPSCALSKLQGTISVERPRDGALNIKLDDQVLFHVQADEGNLMISYPLAFAPRGTKEYDQLMLAIMGVYTVGNKAPSSHVTFDQDESLLMVAIHTKLPAGVKVTRTVINNILLEQLYVGGQVNEVLTGLLNVAKAQEEAEA